MYAFRLSAPATVVASVPWKADDTDVPLSHTAHRHPDERGLTVALISPSAAVTSTVDTDLLEVVATTANLPVVIEPDSSVNATYTVVDKDGKTTTTDGNLLPDEAIVATPNDRKLSTREQLTTQEVGAIESRLSRFTGSPTEQVDDFSLLIELNDIEALSGYTYSYTYVIWKNKKGSTAQAKKYFTKLNKKMDKAFPLKGLPATLKKGKTYKLRPGSNPVKVTGLGSDYFTFKSLPGHAEGPNKSITFRVKYLKPSYRLSLTANGPAKEWQKNPIGGGANKLFAYTMWSHFACGIREHAVNRPCI